MIGVDLYRNPLSCSSRFQMRVLLPLLLVGLSASADPLPVPSGQPVELIEAFWDLTDQSAPTLRVRVLAPQIGAQRAFAEIEPDFLYICRTLALPGVSAESPGSYIVINMLDRAVPFGASDPQAIQFFEAFRVEDGDCVWEGF